MIEGIIVKKLRVIPDERGRLMEILRNDDDIFDRFGQVYITTTYPGIVKAWHYHKEQSDNFTCVCGMIRVALFDARKDSATYGEINEFYIGEHNPALIHIPPGIYHGWKGIGVKEATIVNAPNMPYDREHPDEYRIDPYENSIPYDWRTQEG